MSKQILDIYKEYKIIPNLQDHMLRVAAVASIICDNFNEPLPKEEIVAACLLHDMGNIIKFDMNSLLDFFKSEGVAYWQKVKDEYIKKYGENEHRATLQIVRNLGFEKLLPYVDVVDFKKVHNILDNSNFGQKICFYADSRVDPFGVVSIKQRLEEGKRRYSGRTDITFITEEEREKGEKSIFELEKQIFSKCKMKPEEIDNEAIALIVEGLRGFVV